MLQEVKAMDIGPPDPKNLQEMDFDIVKEEWNAYRLSDGTILRIRPIVIKIFLSEETTPSGKRAMGFVANNVVAARVPKELMRATEDAGEEHESVRVDFEPIKEVWNEFKLKDGSTMRVKLVVSRVLRTSDYNKFGEPVYIATSTNIADLQKPNVSA